jgi:gamma-glutamyltranspeptidase/glutathione hydrolase
MNFGRTRDAALAIVTVLAGTPVLSQDAPVLSVCGTRPAPAACTAVRGERAEGWSAQGRSELVAPHGVVATSQPLAAQAGLRIMMNGGNAIDAAVATAAVLNLVEPESTGLAGDMFAIIYVAREKRLYAINASGTAPTGATLQHLNSLGYRVNPANWGPGSGMPNRGILTVTVPGAAWGWEEVLRRFGTESLGQVLQPAIDYAEMGFPVSERIASSWRIPNALPLRNCCTQPDPDSIATFTIDGAAPVAGQIFKNPELAKTFRLLAQHGRAAFYEGDIARAIIAKSTALGGTMTMADLAGYKGEWVELTKTNYHGYDLFELPPPSQDWAVNEMLNILEACMPRWMPGETLSSLGPRNPKYWHFVVEAKKLAYRDLYTFNADPNFVKVPIERLLSKEYAQSLCGGVDPDRASSTAPRAAAALSDGDTIVLSSADPEGNMVSWINSNFSGFGSGITVPGYGFVLHNRGALFSLAPSSPNVIEPHKRPFNTLSAAFVMKQNEPLMTLLLKGGDMQAQGHAQAFLNVIDLGANLQAAGEMARFRHVQVANRLDLETELYNLVGSQLSRMGHNVSAVNGAQMGGYQAIMFVPGPKALTADEKQSRGGYYRAGSDHREDGQAVGW